MKWDQTEPTRGQFSFATPDYLVDWATTNQKSIRGHALVWYNALPTWVTSITDKAEMTSVIENHVTTLVTRWKGKIRAWDVVNEAFNEDGTMRQSVFYNVLGEDYVRIAFNAAHAADPQAKLYINDFDIEDVSYGKFTGLLNKVKQWRSQNIPIHGIGSQTHLEPNKAASVETALRTLASVVDEVAVTELDIEGANPQEYQTVVEACYHVPTCVGITVWGVRDTDSWRAQYTPLLFADSWAPKDAYYAIRDYLRTLQK